ncbi:MAG: ATP-binding protein [Armatimonadota bacterium]|nr:ATP-binding protein [Armatimonadota bacterium]
MMREVIRQKIVDGVRTTPPPLTPRDVRLPQVPGKAIAVVGMRRVGKTTFLWQVLEERLRAGVPREALLFFSFEDERLMGMQVTDLQMLVEEYYLLYPQKRDRETVVFFLDEVQVVSGWEMFVRRLMDTEKVEVFLSGSSARLLSREVATSMRGRAMEVRLYPFSFREYLRHLRCEPEQPVTHLSKAERSLLQNQLEAYLRDGGFPEAQGVHPFDRYQLLRSYVDLVLLRDVIERYDVSHPVALRWMVRTLLGNPAGMFSVNKMYNELRSQGIAVGKESVYSYVSYLEDAFLVRTVAIAASSERQRMVNPRKVYPVDPALIPLYDRSGRTNIGHSLETCVLIELERRGAEVHYVRTPQGHEVDFLARYWDGREELIQVCADLTDAQTAEREIRALMEASQGYPRAQRVLITLHPAPHPLPEGVAARTALDWFLQGEEVA